MHDLPFFGRAMADVIYAHRTRSRMTQLELAYATGASESYVRRLEKGLQVPTATMLVLLARAFDRPPGDFLAEIVARMAHYQHQNQSQDQKPQKKRPGPKVP